MVGENFETSEMSKNALKISRLEKNFKFLLLKCPKMQSKSLPWLEKILIFFTSEMSKNLHHGWRIFWNLFVIGGLGRSPQKILDFGGAKTSLMAIPKTLGYTDFGKHKNIFGEEMKKSQMFSRFSRSCFLSQEFSRFSRFSRVLTTIIIICWEQTVRK